MPGTAVKIIASECISSAFEAEEAIGVPSHPFPQVTAVVIHKQSQDFFAILERVPANCTVIECRDYIAPVAGDVNLSRCFWNTSLPNLLTNTIEFSDVPVTAQDETVFVRRDRQASRCVILLQLQSTTAGGGMLAVLPSSN